MTPDMLTLALNWLTLVALTALFVVIVMSLLLAGMAFGQRRERRARANTTKHQAVYTGGRASNAVIPAIRRASVASNVVKPPKLWRKLS